MACSIMCHGWPSMQLFYHIIYPHKMQLLKWLALLELHMVDLCGYFVTLLYPVLLMDVIVPG